MKARRWTSICLNLAMVFERADEVVLPAVYSFVARSFDATPTQLATITLSRALVQALASPLGGVLGKYLWLSSNVQQCPVLRDCTRLLHCAVVDILECQGMCLQAITSTGSWSSLVAASYGVS
jgi:hypothetical protein